MRKLSDGDLWLVLSAIASVVAAALLSLGDAAGWIKVAMWIAAAVIAASAGARLTRSPH